MGPSLSYLNIVSIRNCVMLRERDLFSILARHEGKPVRYVQYLPPPNMEVVKMLLDEHFPKDKNKKNKKDEGYNSEEDEENDWYWEDIPDDELSQLEEHNNGVVGEGNNNGDGDDDFDEEFGGKVNFQTAAKKKRRKKAIPGPPHLGGNHALGMNAIVGLGGVAKGKISNNGMSGGEVNIDDDEKLDGGGNKEYIGELTVSSKPKDSKFKEKFQTIPEVAKTLQIEDAILPPEPPKFTYKMHIDTFKDYLMEPALQIERSDMDILCTLWKLNDKMGFGEGDIRMVLIAVCVIVCDDAKHCVDMAFRLYDTTDDHLLDKSDFLAIVKILNEACLYFGDKHLPTSQIVDLIDSIYTSAGRIDGELYYPDHVDAIANHPLMELYLTPQFQGNMRLKSFAEDEILTMNVVVRI